MTIKELFSDESKWTRFALAVDANGREVASTSESAVAWCMLGAVEKCYPPGECPLIAARLNQAIQRYAAADVETSQFNDRRTTTFVDILAVVDMAEI